MPDAIITVENLGKNYWLRHLRNQRYIALAEVSVEKATAVFQGNSKERASDSTREEFWALKNATLEETQGEAVGTVGPNRKSEFASAFKDERRISDRD